MEWIIKYLPSLLEGAFNTVLLTVLVSIGPLVVGCVLSLLANKFPVVGKILGWLSVPFECIVIPVFLLVSYFTLSLLNFRLGLLDLNGVVRWLAMFVTLTVGFAGYMPSRHVAEYSFLKNFLYNGLGLISGVLKWSTCGFMIGFTDLLGATQVIRSKIYETGVLVVPLVVFCVVLLVLDAGRMLIKQFMK